MLALHFPLDSARRVQTPMDRRVRPAMICIEGPDVKDLPSTQSTEVGSSRCFERCESIDTAEPHSPRSSISEEEEELSCKLPKHRVLELQRELLGAFTAPDFQMRLSVIARRLQLCPDRETSFQCWSDFDQLVQTSSAQLILHYDFEASSVQSVLKSLEACEDDQDIYVNAAAIREALFSTMKLPEQERAPAECVGFGRKPATKVAVLEMLQRFIIAFSNPSFQEEVIKLKTRADCNAMRVCDPKGYYHLPGRAELALPLQSPILKSYGFQANKHGVHEMVRACSKYLKMPEVAGAVDAVNMSLRLCFRSCRRHIPVYIACCA